MPEMPEVEVTRRALAPYVEGRTVLRVEVRERRFRWPVPKQLARHLTGHRVLRLERRGKYLLWRFAHGTVISHLGMSGTWRVFERAAPPAAKHDHVDVVMDSGTLAATLRLTDPRRFGALLWHGQRDGDVATHPLLASLGIEPFDAAFDGAYLCRGTRGRTAPIKQVLLAGHVVVGVGNIYASECLYRAGVDPRASARRLSPARCERIVHAVREVLAEAILSGGSTLRDFFGADGARGDFMLDARVYGRAGLPCRACGTSIRRMVQGQRATYWCPRCQRR